MSLQFQITSLVSQWQNGEDPNADTYRLVKNRKKEKKKKDFDNQNPKMQMIKWQVTRMGQRRQVKQNTRVI